MPSINHMTVRETREAAYEMAKAKGDKAGARAILIELRKEREQREGLNPDRKGAR